MSKHQSFYAQTWCAVCAEPYTPKSYVQRTCSPACGRVLGRVTVWLRKKLDAGLS